MEKVIIIVLVVAGLLAGCTAVIKKDKENTENIEEPKVKYSKLKAKEAKDIIDTEEVIILDVRTPGEYEEGHIEGALLIPDYDLTRDAESKLPDKDDKILVYCRSGSRSKSAAKVLIDMGYTDVHDLAAL